MLTLAISFDHFQFALIHGPDIPGSYAILLFTASDLASITSHIHNWVLFLLWLYPFILSGVISPLISCSILGTYQPGDSSFSILSFCLFVLFMGFSRQGYWSGLPFPLQWTTFCQTSPPWPARLGLPRRHNFHWVRQGCGPSVIRLTSFLWVWFQRVCLLMPSCNTYHPTWVSLTLGVGYLFMAAPEKSLCIIHFCGWNKIHLA